MDLNSSPYRPGALPAPADAIMMLRGLAFAYVMNSGTVLAGNEGLTSMTPAVRDRLATGAMSLMKLKLRFSYSVALIALKVPVIRSGRLKSHVAAALQCN